MNETSTNFFEVLERPLEELTIVWTNGLQDSFTRDEALQFLNAEPLVTPEPGGGGSTLNSLWTWSLQFEIPLWFIALLALGLGLTVLWHLASMKRGRRQSIARNYQRYIAHNMFTSFR